MRLAARAVRASAHRVVYSRAFAPSVRSDAYRTQSQRYVPGLMSAFLPCGTACALRVRALR